MPPAGPTSEKRARKDGGRKTKPVLAAEATSGGGTDDSESDMSMDESDYDSDAVYDSDMSWRPSDSEEDPGDGSDEGEATDYSNAGEGEGEGEGEDEGDASARATQKKGKGRRARKKRGGKGSGKAKQGRAEKRRSRRRKRRSTKKSKALIGHEKALRRGSIFTGSRLKAQIRYFLEQDPDTGKKQIHQKVIRIIAAMRQQVAFKIMSGAILSAIKGGRCTVTENDMLHVLDMFKLHPRSMRNMNIF